MPQVNILVVETLFLPEKKRNPVNVDRAQRLLTKMLGAIDVALEGRDYFAGEFSGADIMTGHACIVSARLGGDISDKPNVAAYIDRLQARPALQKAWNA
jgi:glutathione S-transferase